MHIGVRSRAKHAVILLIDGIIIRARARVFIAGKNPPKTVILVVVLLKREREIEGERNRRESIKSTVIARCARKYGLGSTV